MIRRIIKFDQDRCNGCGLCAQACHEGAIVMANGKAVLLRDDYCDGLGDCLPVCPTDAIAFVKREAAAYDAKAVKANASKALSAPAGEPAQSCLAQWPVQIKLMHPGAACLNEAHLLIAADCTAYAYARFHEDFMKGRVTLIGCPKLDDADYAEKLAAILGGNDIPSITVVRMEVPCCCGLSNAVRRALVLCGKDIPCQVNTIGTQGHLLDTKGDL